MPDEIKPLLEDGYINAVQNGMKRDIDIAIENDCLRAAIILIFAAMDAMGHIGRPAGKVYNEPSDFYAWVDKYFDLGTTTKITPQEWYAARTAIIHTYGTYARAHGTDRASPQIRVLGFAKRDD